jgi:hypothetical protein
MEGSTAGGAFGSVTAMIFYVRTGEWGVYGLNIFI